MNIDARKISIVQEFLKINNEMIIQEIENILHKSKTEKSEAQLEPMSIESFNREIDESLQDEKNGKLINGHDLRKKAEKWT